MGNASNFPDSFGIYIILFYSNVRLWYYYIDIAILEIIFFVTIASSLLHLSMNQHDISFKTLVKRFILPILAGVSLFSFIWIYLSKTFAGASSLKKYIIRLVIYPILADTILAIQEFNFRQFLSKDYTVHGLTYFVYVAQVILGFFGRYMTTTSGNLVSVTIFAAVIAIKDVLFHRLSRAQCWIGFYLKKIFKLNDINNEGTFDDWFFEENFTKFRACVLHNDFLQELTG